MNGISAINVLKITMMLLLLGWRTEELVTISFSTMDPVPPMVKMGIISQLCRATFLMATLAGLELQVINIITTQVIARRTAKTHLGTAELQAEEKSAKANAITLTNATSDV